MRRILPYICLHLSLALTSLVLAAPALADTWAERLGYPAGAKVIVLHANELGLAYETNAAGAKLLDEGPVRSAGAMVPAPWFADFAAWSKAHPNADIGLELTLNSELANYRYKPVTSTGLVPSLVGGDDFLWQLPVQSMVNATAGDVERELRAQINRARNLGINPSHLTTHMGTLVTRPDFMEVYLRIARQEWIPAMIVEVTPEQVERFRSQGFPLPDEVIALLENYPLPKVDDLRFLGDEESYDATKQAFLKLLGELSPGITQIAFPAAVESEALPRIAPNAEQRVWNAQLFADEEVRQALAAENVVITDWREIMRRFEGRPELSEPAASSDQ
ncbi:MAG: polysaccharide deacetylase family protein [Pirellulales bacterium]